MSSAARSRSCSFWNSYLGRLRLTPSAAVGFAASIPLFGDPEVAPIYLSHLGIVFRIAGSVLITRDLMLFVETGLGVWAGLHEVTDPQIVGPMSSSGGFLLGGGITIK